MPAENSDRGLPFAANPETPGSNPPRNLSKRLLSASEYPFRESIEIPTLALQRCKAINGSAGRYAELT